MIFELSNGKSQRLIIVPAVQTAAEIYKHLEHLQPAMISSIMEYKNYIAAVVNINDLTQF